MAVRRLTEEEQAQHERVNGRFGDARAQLWARVYATEYSICRARQGGSHGSVVFGTRSDRVQTFGHVAMREAREAADIAVRDFDEHYLRGPR